MRLTKIYTRKGDAGYTTLRNERIPKDDVLIEVLGTLDELNSFIGLILSFGVKDNSILQVLTTIQHQLFDMGGELHLPEKITITADNVTQLENWLDQWNTTLPPLKEFLLPRGNSVSATCHVARTICRRAERLMVKLNRQTALSNPNLLCYLNRLSDLLFVLARIFALETKQEEVLWEQK